MKQFCLKWRRGLIRRELRGGGYFNSGVLLFNLRLFRRDVDIDFYIRLLEENADQTIFYDQGILNLAFADRTKLLRTCRYNYRIDFSLPDKFSRENYHRQECEEYLFMPFAPAIVHYCGGVPKIANKPWEFKLTADEIRRCVVKEHHYIPEVQAYFDIWWNYAEKVSDYETLFREARLNTVSYLVCNRFFERRMETINALGVETLRVPVMHWKENDIGSGEDLNDFRIPKVYRCVSGSIKKTVKNLPEAFVQNRGFRLVVKNVAAHDTRYHDDSCIQILEPNLPEVPVFRRFYYGAGSGRWSPWYQAATVEECKPYFERNEKQYLDLKAEIQEIHEQIYFSDEMKQVLAESSLQTRKMKKLEAEIEDLQRKVEMQADKINDLQRMLEDVRKGQE